MVRSSLGGGGEGCTRYSKRSLDAVPGENDRLADCPPEEFNATEGWCPYTPGEARRTFAGSFVSFRVSQASPPDGGCTPNFPLGMDKEFMLTSFHLRACLRRTSLTISGKRRQVAFCPYCGVTNDNVETGLKTSGSIWT